MDYILQIRQKIRLYKYPQKINQAKSIYKNYGVYGMQNEDIKDGKEKSPSRRKRKLIPAEENYSQA